MLGRAGRPQFDKFGKAVVLVHDIKKEYYKKVNNLNLNFKINF